MCLLGWGGVFYNPPSEVIDYLFVTHSYYILELYSFE